MHSRVSAVSPNIPVTILFFLRISAEHKVLKCTVNAPWYVRKSDLHRDLGIETVTDIIAKFAKSHEKRLQRMYLSFNYCSILG
jgi:hypothetical protein